MLTPAEHAEWCRRLDERRAERQASFTGTGSTVWPTPDDTGLGVVPIELAPGRGDLRYSSMNVPSIPIALDLVGHKIVSFARLFQSQPWIASAVMWMLTRAVRVPLKAYRRVGGENERNRLYPGDHPIADLLVNPWRDGSGIQLTMAMLGPILVHGNSVIEIDDTSRTGRLQLAPRDWRFSMPIMPWRGSLDGFIFDYDNPAFRHEQSVDKVLHTAWWSPTGPIGTSPLQQLGITLGIEDAAQRYQRAIFLNGARPPSAITMTEQFLGLKPHERALVMAQIREDIAEIYSGPENAGRPALLPPGLDWKSIGASTVEAILIDQRKITREEIAGVYQIPPPLLGILDRATYSNIETQRDLTYTDCLGPPLILVEQAINTQIIRNLLQEPDVFVEHDFTAVLRGSTLEEIQAIREGIGTGIMTPNEGRDARNMPRSPNPGMDQFYLPFNNLQPVGSPPAPPPAPFGGSQAPQQAPQPPPRALHVRSRDRDYALALP